MDSVGSAGADILGNLGVLLDESPKNQGKGRTRL